MTLSSTARRPLEPGPMILADALLGRSLTKDVLLVVGGAALTGLLAQLYIPLRPVPVTGQTLAVLLVGSSLGRTRGAAAMVAYLGLGVVGVPWFSEAGSGFAAIAGPSGGYLVGFVLSAALTGWLAERAWDRTPVKAVFTFVAGTVSVFALGLPWLAFSLHLDLTGTLEAGLYPFLIGGAVKAAIATALLPVAWKLTSRLGSH